MAAARAKRLAAGIKNTPPIPLRTATPTSSEGEDDSEA